MQRYSIAFLEENNCAMIQSLEGSRISVTEMKQNTEDQCDKNVVQLHFISKRIGEILDVANILFKGNIVMHPMKLTLYRGTWKT